MQRLRLIGQEQKDRVCEIVQALPLSPVMVVEIKQSKTRRSLDQNARMWAMLSDISRQVEWHGVWLTSENWKDMFTAALKRQQVVPGIDGGFVVLGASTKSMSCAEMIDMIDFMLAFGSEHGVVFKDPTLPIER